MIRKKTAYMVLLFLFMLVLAACGRTTTESANGTSVKQNTAVEEKEVQTVKHLKGTAVLPQKIERMVVLSAAYIDHMLTIGEKPAGVNVEVRYGGDYLPYLADRGRRVFQR